MAEKDYDSMTKEIAEELRSLKRENERLKYAEEFILRMAAISRRFVNECLYRRQDERQFENVKDFISDCATSDVAVIERRGGPDSIYVKAKNDYFGIENEERVVLIRRGEGFEVFQNTLTREFVLGLKDGTELLVAMYNPFGDPIEGTDVIVDEHFELHSCRSGGFYY
ncbi:hypothetical protein OIO07_03355 [Bacillus paralicheniformis]|uniref:Uncharacterized protein n=1 Tax=Bacillus paralicheniformis TaxID=1648923 RepID=A0AAW6KJ45_9BACI|nr:hypothetical protein [Bacillus paralicheniformis]MBG9882735.1 hypothetical protein [Bacillus paralicheniformis]MCV9367305.1 hypothetical protein [Bacillus paralicheniformis]MDE1454626.1 hypothetical protein [Bacillus paralicheniformis]WIG09973.1 hypothetical protein QN340_23180 [Bacillus paralicheniformis]